MAIILTTRYKPMIERLDTLATLQLLVAMRKLAESDVRRYGRKAAKYGGGFVGYKDYKSAVHYLNEELPVIREVLGESFRES